jgi:rubrerythrin
MADDTTDVQKMLERCREIELTCADLYRFFAQLFIDEAEYSALWRKTAMEEENHASQFTLAQSISRHGTIKDLNAGLREAEGALQLVRSLMAKAKEAKPSMLAALEAAIALEERLSAFHTTTVANFTSESHAKMFQAMMQTDSDHIGSLRQMQQRLKG